MDAPNRRTLLAQAAAAFAWGASGAPAFARPASGSAGSRSTGSRSTFHAIYDDIRLRDRFFLFLQNVFHLYPEAELHQLIVDMCDAFDTDEQIYAGIRAGLGQIKPLGAEVTYAMPSLAKQKRVLSRQCARIVAEGGLTQVDGYVEIGTTGRYVRSIDGYLALEGDKFIVNHIAPTNGVIDLIERGQWAEAGTFVPLGNYDPIDSAIGKESVDLVTNFIGFHHCPDEQLEGFIRSIHAVLRPGGRLVVREHDVHDGTMSHLVALAHDVFNAGTGLTWEANQQEYRHFRSLDEWQMNMRPLGFDRSTLMLEQRHDPTHNVLAEYIRV